MSDTTPTERFDAVPTAPVGDDAPKSKTLLYVLIGVGALLLIVVVALLAMLAGRESGGPIATTASPSPTASVSPTPQVTETSSSPTPVPEEPAPAPAPTVARFKTFDAPSSQPGCSTGGPGSGEYRPLLEVSWSTAGADEAWFVMGTSDAADSGFMQIALNGNQSDFQYPIEFNCSQDSTTYTITLVAPDGDHVSKSWTVENPGDKF